MLIHFSDLSLLARCPAMLGYRRAGLPDQSNSASAFGSVMHHCIEAMERMVYADKVPIREAAQRAVETFAHYWHPMNIEAICEPVPPDGWLPKQGFMELRARGIDSIWKYADLMRYDDHEVLALEYGFNVPVDGTWDEDAGEPHRLVGTVDRLCVRFKKRKPMLCVDDLKTGKEYVRLRHNLQFTVYLYATTQIEFWVGSQGEDGFGKERGEELWKRFEGVERTANWVNLRKFAIQDAGTRGPIDFERLRLAVSQYAALVQADIFPLSISGENCEYCPYRRVCGGTGLAPDENGHVGAPPR